MARLNPNGTFDPIFGSNGKVITDFGSNDEGARAMAIHAEDKIIVAGFTTAVDFDFAVARYNLLNGSLDSTFGNGGKVVDDLGSFNDVANAVAVQPDGKIIAAG